MQYICFVYISLSNNCLLLVSVPRKKYRTRGQQISQSEGSLHRLLHPWLALTGHHSTAWFALARVSPSSARGCVSSLLWLWKWNQWRIATRDCVPAACANYLFSLLTWFTAYFWMLQCAPNAPTYLVSKRLVRIRRCHSVFIWTVTYGLYYCKLAYISFGHKG